MREIAARTSNNNEGDALGLTTAQVNLLAAQGEYCVRQSAHLFRELLGQDLPTILGPAKTGPSTAKKI